MKKKLKSFVDKLLRDKKIMLIILFAMFFIIVIFAILNILSKNNIDSRFYGQYESQTTIIKISPNGKCSISSVDILNRAATAGSTCSWFYKGMFDKDFKLSKEGIMASALVTIKQDNQTMELNIVFTEDYVAFIDTTNNRMIEYYKTRDYEGNQVKAIENTNNSILAMNKPYVAAILNNGKKAYITFNEDGTCEPDFLSFSNAGSVSGDTMYVFYQRDNEPCTYKVKDNIVSVYWLGTYEQVYEFDVGANQTQTSTIGQGYIMKDIKFKYDEENDIISVVNGKWDIVSDSPVIVKFLIDNGNNTLNENIDEINFEDIQIKLSLDNKEIGNYYFLIDKKSEDEYVIQEIIVMSLNNGFERKLKKDYIKNIIKIGDLNYGEYSINEIPEIINNYNITNIAKNGDYGVYTSNEKDDYRYVKIYCPKENKAIYLQYTVSKEYLDSIFYVDGFSNSFNYKWISNSKISDDIGIDSYTESINDKLFITSYSE